MPNLSNELKQLEDMFRFWNKTYFDGIIEEPVITLIPDHRGRAYSWCTTYKAWGSEKLPTTVGFYEINICADQLNRSIEEITGTLLHEMVHLYNLQIGVQDCSRGNTYHNKKFKEEAEKRGLIISFNKKIGWSVTQINDETKKIIKREKFKAIKLQRKEEIKIQKPKQSMRKYVCPCCGCIIRATKEVHVSCIDCNEDFILEI